MAAEIVPFFKQFDPLAADAEDRYDRVVARYNMLTARGIECQRTIDEIERQFVENDLTTNRPAHRGAPLSSERRRRRLWHFVCLNRQVDAIGVERERLQHELDLMNDALETWAREAYAADVTILPPLAGGSHAAAGDDSAPAGRH
jgi:hypothetical protein